MYITINTIYIMKAIHKQDMLLLTPADLGQRGADPVCGHGRQCLRSGNAQDLTPGAFHEGGSR